jgi:hypothetical protein
MNMTGPPVAGRKVEGKRQKAQDGRSLALALLTQAMRTPLWLPTEAGVASVLVADLDSLVCGGSELAV